MDVNSLSPIEALNKIYEWQKKFVAKEKSKSALCTKPVEPNLKLKALSNFVNFNRVHLRSSLMNFRHLILLLFLICFLFACSKSTDLPPSPEPTSNVTLKETPTLTRTIKYTSTVVRTKTPTPTATQTLTATITSTSTPQPPLVAHTWKLENVLLEIESVGGDGCCLETFPPDLVLYSNGLLIRSKYENGMYEMMARKLKRKEMCALFNTLDQVGFLDYDPSVYQDPMMGLGNTYITVNLWKKQQIYGQVLDKWIYEGDDWWYELCNTDTCQPAPVILPALSNAYKLLDQYDPGGLEKLSPQQLVLWAIPEGVGVDIERELIPWPVKEISLLDIAQEATEENYYTIFLDDPVLIRALNGKVAPGLYFQSGVKRIITIRPLWPAETHYGMMFYGLPKASPIVPEGTTMSCYPEDGLISVPK